MLKCLRCGEEYQPDSAFEPEDQPVLCTKCFDLETSGVYLNNGENQEFIWDLQEKYPMPEDEIKEWNRRNKC